MKGRNLCRGTFLFNTTNLKTMRTATNYQKQAADFLNAARIKFSCKHLKYGKHFADDTESRHIFTITLSRGRNRVSFQFGQSIFAGSKEPTAYDLLSSLTKSDPGSFEDFCREYGYNTNNSGERTYRAVCKEWEKVERFFTTEEIEALYEIQ